jgi:hypothetical protein
LIIDHDRKFTFIHVPRTGGFSAYKMLGGQTPGRMHPPRSEIEEDYFSFGFIRNPWDRMYSVYRKQKDMPKHMGVGFKEFVMHRISDNGIRYCAMTFLDGCDFIGRYENLQDDWNLILGMIGMERQILPRVNQCGSADYHKRYDSELIDFIALHHKADIDWGGYTFE